VRTASFDVRATASLHAFPRVGFVVPKYKHSGVERNRVKRRLRELVRLHVLEMLETHASEQSPVDLVVRIFPSAYGREYATLHTELEQAVRSLLRQLRRRDP
jgi:ribonuclease P protein component